MKALTVFENEKFGSVRSMLDENGEPWFVGKDVAEALGYSNTRDALDRHVDPEDKNTVVNPDGNRGNPNMTIINESGLYSLIMSSKLEGAKEFKHWVTAEVLPSIRKTGSYTVPREYTETEKMEIAAREREARLASANFLKELASNYEGRYHDILLAHATKELTGEFLLPLPKAERRTYSATEIGAQLGVSAHKIGTIANQHNLKTSEYGEWVVDKARHASKEVQSFRYYDNIVPILSAIIGGDNNEG